MPPRATPADYQSHAQAGNLTIGAEFDGHSVATPPATYTTEDYVAVEVALFGPPETHLTLSHEDFSLRLDKKKTPLPAQPYELLFKSLKDPQWVEPQDGPKQKGLLGNEGKSDGELPKVVHMPVELQRAMELNTKNASLPEGTYGLPLAGMIYFRYYANPKSLHSIELIYTGAAGKATVALQP